MGYKNSNMDLEQAERRIKTFTGEMTLTGGMRVRHTQDPSDCKFYGNYNPDKHRRGFTIATYSRGSRCYCRLEYVPGALERKWRVLRDSGWKRSYKLLDSALDTIAQHMRR
jgi:hypothetical protein